MFFLIGGVQPKTVLVERESKICPSCGYAALQKKRIDHYFSLFFIPLFPVKKGSPFLICDKCQNIADHDGRIGGEKKNEYQKCKNCGRSSQPDFSFCPYCGKPL